MMKQHINRIISACLALLLCVGLFAIPVSAEEISGTCGENLTWTLDAGVLTISGRGAMENYSEHSLAPWYAYADRIQRVVVSSGVTSVGNMAFYQCNYLTAAVLADSVTTLGSLAFNECRFLAMVTMPGVKSIGWGCFYGCTSLTNIILPQKLESIGDKAFYFCTSLAGVTVPASVTELGNYAFCYCNNLVYVDMQANIDTLPFWAFYGCELLEEVYLPDTITSVEDNALGDCPSLSYVDFGGSEAVRQEIDQKLAQDSAASGTPSNKPEVEYTKSESVQITTKTEQTGGTQWEDEVTITTTITATITDKAGWDEIVDAVTDSLRTGEIPKVTIQVMDNVDMDKNALKELALSGATVTVVTPDNVSWEVILDDQTSDSLGGQQNFSVSMVKNQPGAYADILGNAVSYTVTLSGTTLNTTIKLPLGRDTARQVATLYSIQNRKLNKLSSVIIDDDGMAAFCVAGTAAGEYILAINVQGIPQQEVNIPQALAPSYNIDYSQSTLTDSQGNQYIITGTRNDIGFGLGTLTLIVVGVLVGSVVVVGAIMITWNKSKQKAMPYRKKRP